MREIEVANENKSNEVEAEFLAKADVLFDQLMVWDEQTHEPNMTQIEEIVLQLGEQMAQALMARQEKRQPAEKVCCPECQGVAVSKGQKRNRVESRQGSLQLERSHYYCPHCQKGFYPPG
jgi:uncharacterized protein with PIN domain